MVLGTTILSNGKGHFGPTDRDKRTGQSGPPSKLVPNITVGLNRNGPFHLMYQPKFPESWIEWKAPHVFKKRSKSIYHFVASKGMQSSMVSPCKHACSATSEPFAGVKRTLLVTCSFPQV